MVLGSVLSIASRKYPAKIALVHGETRLLFSEINERVNRLANALQALGINCGDRIALRAKNCTQCIEFFFAAAKCGAIAVPTNPALKEQEFSYMIRDSGSQVLFIQEADIEFCQSLSLTDLGIKHTICFERGIKEFRDYEQLLRQASPDEPHVPVQETDPAMIVYTSGTTGSPKGVTLSHKNCLTNTRHFDLEMRLEHHHVMLLVYPFFHTAGIASIFNVYYVGAKLVLALNTVPSDILKTIEREKVTDMSIVTTLLNALCNVPGVEQYDLSSFRLFGYGAAIMPVEQLKWAIKIFKCGFLGVFGTTEAAPCVTALRVMDHEAAMNYEDKRGLLASCGRAMVGVETRIVDSEDQDVKIGDVGEFCVRGENVMLGYWNKPEETAFALRNGWYHTGDLARQDEEGYVYIVDRIKDIIISGGENIASREVEEVIYALPGVLEVAVIGLPDPYWGESVAAVVVRKPKAQVSENDVVDLCKAKLAPFKKPKTVFFADALPKNATGKILKTELRAQYVRTVG